MVHPLREQLLPTRVLSMADYMSEGCGYTKITRVVSNTLYGTSIVPIAVPLRPGEELAVYEARFHKWGYRERNHELDDLRTKPNLERSFRVSFAHAEARAYALELLDIGDVKKKEPILDEVKEEPFLEEIKEEPFPVEEPLRVAEEVENPELVLDPMVGKKREREAGSDEEPASEGGERGSQAHECKRRRSRSS